MSRPPEGKLRDVDPEIVTEQRIAHPIGDALPGEGHVAPPPGDPGSHQETEKHPGHHHHGKQGARGQRLAELEVGDVAPDLNRADSAIDQEQMPDEPGGRDQAAGQVEGELEQVPVGEKFGGGRRELGGPPAVGQESGGPASNKEEGNQRPRSLR